MHKAGQANANADALSRNVKHETCEGEEERNIHTIKENTDTLKVPTEKEKVQILKEYHDTTHW